MTSWKRDVVQRRVGRLHRHPGARVERAGDAEADRLDARRPRRSGSPEPRRRPSARGRPDPDRRQDGWYGDGSPRSASTAPARSLVPPRSTPMTPRSTTRATIPLPPWPTTTTSLSTPSTAPARASPGARSDGGLRRPAREPRRGPPAAAGDAPEPPRRRRRFTVGRVVGYLAMAVGAWLLVSLVLFLISAQIQSVEGLRRGRGEAQRRRLPAHLAEHDPRARLRRAREGQGRAGSADDRPGRAGRTRSCCCGSAAAPTRSCRSCATRSSTSPATGATRSTPRTRSAARRWRSRPSSSTSASTSTTSSRSTSRTSRT